MDRVVVNESRVELVDALRGFALFGVFLMNIYRFSLYVFLPPKQAAVLPLARFDFVSAFVQNLLCDNKFNTLFTFLFGVGFAMLLRKEHERGLDFVSLYRRRMLVLIAIGLVHLTLLSMKADVLAMYGLVGLVLLWFRRANDRTLLAWAGCLLLSQLALTVLIVLSQGALDPGAPLRRTGDWLAKDVFGFNPGWTYADRSREIYTHGTLLEVMKLNLTNLFYRYGFLLSSGRLPRVLALFLVGLWVGRPGILQNPANHTGLLWRVVSWGLPIGLVANVFVALNDWEAPPPHSLAVIGNGSAFLVGVVPLSMAYAALFSLLWLRPVWRRLLSTLVPPGRMPLTNYVMQSVIGAGLFYGIGLGLGGTVGPSWFFAIVGVVVPLQVMLSAWWLKRFRFGPLEWAWRSLTYGRAQDMSIVRGRAAAAAAP